MCDAVEAMASDRPYHQALTLDQIVAELRRCAGTQFDPAVVEAFVKVTERRGSDFVVNSAREVRLPDAAAQGAANLPGQGALTKNRPGTSAASATRTRLSATEMSA